MRQKNYQDERSVSEDLFSGADQRFKTLVRPGIITNIQEFMTDGAKASATAGYSRATSHQISHNMTALDQAGYTERVEKGQEAENRYWFGDLEPAIEEAEELYEQRIDTVLDEFDEQDILEDLEDIGIITLENGGKEYLCELRNEDYSQETLGYFSELNLIDAVDNRELTADDYDLEMLEEELLSDS